MTRALSVEKLGASYGREKVIHELSFEVGTRDFFVVAGPNGSGKSTLLKILAGLHHPSNGNITLFGRPLASCDRRELSRIVAYMPQTVPLDFPFTVEEVVLMGRSPHLGLFQVEGRADMEKAREAMESTQVAHLARRPIDQLSGGERQRVFLAQALCQEPRLILLDEPTAALDLAHQVHLMDLLEELRRERDLTILMVSHDINLAAMYGNRILLLKDGRAVGQGPPLDLLTLKVLEETYGCVVIVEPSSLGEFPRVTPVPGRYLDLRGKRAIQLFVRSSILHRRPKIP